MRIARWKRWIILIISIAVVVWILLGAYDEVLLDEKTGNKKIRTRITGIVISERQLRSPLGELLENYDVKADEVEWTLISASNTISIFYKRRLDYKLIKQEKINWQNDCVRVIETLEDSGADKNLIKRTLDKMINGREEDKGDTK